MAGTGGKREGAGRKTLFDEQIRILVLEKSWQLIKEYIEDESEPRKDRVKVAEHLAGKSVPQNLNIGGQKDNPLGLQIVVNKPSA